MVGGGGERKTLRIVAEHADIWNVFGTPETLVHKDAVLREHCADVGRDPGDDRTLGRLQDHHPVEPRPRPNASGGTSSSTTARRLERVARATHTFWTGTPEQIAETMIDYRRIGFHTFLVEHAGAVRRRDDGDAHHRSSSRWSRPRRSELTPTRRIPGPAPPGPGVSSATMPRVSTGRVFRRSTVADPPIAVEAHGSTIRDADGRDYLDAAGGAIVVNVGHGRREIAAAMADQAGRLAYAHGSAFTTEPLEAYAREVARHLPIDDPAIYPVSGGSEAIETALKLARAYHLARGESERWIVYARWGSYHGNTLGALDLSGRKPLRRPYEGWLGRFRHVSAAYPYRADMPGRERPRAAPTSSPPSSTGRSRRPGPGTVAAFVAEPIVGATLAAAVPPDGYWPAIADVCRRHGVLLIADEVMTGFGRTGRWFATRPLGGPAGHPRRRQGRRRRATGRSGSSRPRSEVHATVTGAAGFVHGFTYSHSPVGAAVAREVLRILEDESLVEASAEQGRAPASALASAAFGEHPAVGEIRGRGLLVGIELVADRATREPFPRAARVTEAVVAGRARTRRPGLLRHGLRQRRGWRHDPARAAVHRDRRRAGAHRDGRGGRHRGASRHRSADVSLDARPPHGIVCGTSISSRIRPRLE